MKKVLKKFNRALSIMLVAAMVLTMAPTTAMPVFAATEEAEPVVINEPADPEPAPEENSTLKDVEDSDTSDDNDGQPDEQSADTSTGESTDTSNVTGTIDNDPNEDVTPASGDNETGVTVTGVTEPVEEPDDVVPATKEPVDEPTEEIVEPTITDPETPETPTVTEDPTAPTAEESGEIKVDGVEIMDAAEVTNYTISIKDYTAIDDRVNITAVAAGTAVDSFPTNGKLTVEAKKAAELTITAKDGYKIKSVKNGSEAVEGTKGTYKVSISSVEADVEVSIETVETYTVKLDITKAAGKSIKLDDTLKDLASVTELKDGALESTVEKGVDLKFSTAADEHLTVSYIEEDSTADDAVPIPGELSEDKKTSVYKVDKDEVIAGLKSITIVLEVAEQKTVTVDTTNAAVQVQVTGADGKTSWADYSAASGSENNKVYPGKDFVFRAKAKDGNYVIDEVTKTVKTEKDTVSPTEDTADKDGYMNYKFTVTDDTAVAFTTKPDAAKSNHLTFKIDGDAGSATAKITSIKYKDSADAVQTASTGADIAKFLGITLPSGVTDVTLEADTPVTVLKTATEIQVTVTASKGYELTKVDDEANAVANRVYTIKTGADAAKKAEIEFAAETEVKAATELKAAVGAHYFKVTLAKDADKDVFSNLQVTNPESEVKQKKDGADETKIYYEVAEGVKTVTFTVDAVEGYKLPDAFVNTAKSVDAGEPAGGKVTYTVALFAGELTGTTDAYASAQEITLTPEAIKLKAEVEPASAERKDFTVSEFTYTPAGTDTIAQQYTEGNSDIPYNAALHVKITSNNGCKLDKVAYTVGGVAGDSVTIEKNTATVDIPHVTGDVKITVESSKSYQASALLKEADDGNSGSIVTEYDWEEDIYQVNYAGKYWVGLQDGSQSMPAKDFSVAVLKADGTKVPMSAPIVAKDTTKRRITLNKTLQGETLTVNLYLKGKETEAPVAHYNLQVIERTTYITVNGDKAIELPVDSIGIYPIETDGVLKNPVVTADVGSIIDASELCINKNGELVVQTAPNSTDAIKGKEATITIAAADNDQVKATVKVTATPLFDKTKSPEVFEIKGGQADTVLNVEVDMKDVKTPETGSVWYKVTARAQAKIKEGDTEKAFAGSDEEKVLIETPAPVYVKKPIKEGDKAVAKINVGKIGGLGTGATWTYDVTATLVYLDGNDEDYGSSGNVVEESVPSKDPVAVSTDGDIKFTSALKVKKNSKNGTLYTGQSGTVTIGTVEFKDKDYTAYQILNENLEDSFNGEAVNQLGLEVVGKEIRVTDVPDNADLGKHTITVLAAADETKGHTMYATRATLTVNVVKGINELTITQPSESIYKNPDAKKTKAVTLKLGVEYNSGEYNWNGKKRLEDPAPKKKSVKWEIVGADSEDYDSSDITNFEIVRTGDALEYLKIKDKKNGVTINEKNGTITVAKPFSVSSKKKNNQFKVLVTATDFEGNTTAALSETITITNTETKIAQFVIVDDDNKVVQILSGTKPILVTAKNINGAYLYAMPTAEGAVEGKELDLSKVIPTENITFKSSSPKVLQIGGKNQYGYPLDSNLLTVYAAGKNVTVNAALNDGSKQKGKVTLKLDYNDMGKDLALSITSMSGDGYDDGSEDDLTISAVPGTAPKAGEEINVPDFSIAGAARLNVQICVGDQEGGKSTKFSPAESGFADYKLAVKGGKIFEQGPGYAYVTTTAEDTKLTLTDTSVKKGKKPVYTYVLKNKAYAENAKAKVTVEKGGSLHEYAPVEEQTLNLFVVDASTKKPFAGKQAKVEVDWSAVTAKNLSMMNKFNECIASGGSDSHVFSYGAEDGKLKLTFANINGYSDTLSFPAGSYKLKVTVGTGSGKEFKPAAKSATVSVKVVKNKKFTFKPNTTFSISKADGSAPMGYKSSLNAKADEKVNVVSYVVQNNVVKKTGKANNFTRYFKAEQDPANGSWRLKLNTDEELVQNMLKDNTDLKSIPKDDLTGYLTYQVKPNVGYYDVGTDTVTGTVKITVKPVADAQGDKKAKLGSKYVPNKPEVGLDDKNNTTEVNIMVGSEFVNVGYVEIDGEKSAKELALTGKNKDGVVGLNDKGQICLKATGVAEKGSYTANLVIVPKDSCYLDKILKAANGTPETKINAAGEGDKTEGGTEPPASQSPPKTRQQLLAQYGVAVKVTVKAVKTPAKTPDPKPETKPTPGTEDQKIDDTIVQAVADAKNIEIDAAKVTIDQAKQTGTITSDDAAVLATAIKTAAGNTVKDYNLAVATELTNVTAPNGSTDGTGKADVTISREGYKDATAQVNVTIKAATGGGTPTVTGVTITSPTANQEVEKGGTVTCTATVAGTGLSQEQQASVTWTIETTNTGGGTKIQNGELSIDANETNETITIKAASTVDTNKSATVTIKVKNTTSS